MSETDSALYDRERPRLIGVAYRMLGDVAASEDIVQDAFVRWSTRRDREVRSPAAYLTTIVTRLAMDRLGSAAARRETYVGPWLSEPVLYDPAAPTPGPDDSAILAESVTLGFLKILDTLSPVERAVFLLHDVFDLNFAETAAVVNKSESTCRKIASRARTKVTAHREPTRRRAGSDRELELVSAFGQALAAGDVEGVKNLLTSEVTMTSDGGGVKYAAVRVVVGADRVSRFFIGVSKKFPDDVRVEMATVNGEPAFMAFFSDQLDSVLTIGVSEEGIDHIHVVRNPEKLSALTDQYRLGL